MNESKPALENTMPRSSKRYRKLQADRDRRAENKRIVDMVRREMKSRGIADVETFDRLTFGTK